jgi:DNA-binding NarL/FixJ family response regulator
MTKIRVLLAEDHQLVREGLKLLVDNQPDMETIGDASDGRAAVRLAEQLRPDVVIMDVSMPGMNGLRATETLTQSCPGTKVLVLTRHTDEGFVHQLLRAGASGYVVKQSAPAELLAAVRAVAAGGRYLDPAIAGKVIDGFARSRASMESDAPTDLSERETEVLRHIARGYSNKEVAARLEVSVKTVEAHKANAMRKLEMRGRIDLVRYAVLRGWLEDL